MILYRLPNGSRFPRRVPENNDASCGMNVWQLISVILVTKQGIILTIRDRKSCRPIVRISIPSILMLPFAGST